MRWFLEGCALVLAQPSFKIEDFNKPCNYAKQGIKASHTSSEA